MNILYLVFVNEKPVWKKSCKKIRQRIRVLRKTKNLKRSYAIQKQSPKVLCWKIGTLFGSLARNLKIGMLARLWHVVTLARLLACWHVKMKFWHTSDTLACMHVDHAGTHGTRFSKAPLNASVGKTWSGLKVFK